MSWFNIFSKDAADKENVSSEDEKECLDYDITINSSMNSSNSYSTPLGGGTYVTGGYINTGGYYTIGSTGFNNTVPSNGITYNYGYPSTGVHIQGGSPHISTDKSKIDIDELASLMEMLKERLLIIVPNFEKHEKYEALKKAYDHYKLIEKMLGEDNGNNSAN